LPHAETAIAAAQRPARTEPKMTRLASDATRPRPVRFPSMEKQQQQATGDGKQATGDRRQDAGAQERLRKGHDIAERLVVLGAEIVRLLRALPRDPAGKHLAIQLFRCATSPGANYEEALAAESRADFVHKASIAAKEMRETRFWLDLLNRSGWLKQDLTRLIHEARELSAILAASVRTARRSSRR